MDLTIVLEKLFPNGLKHCKDNNVDFNDKQFWSAKFHENSIFRNAEYGHV